MLNFLRDTEAKNKIPGEINTKCQQAELNETHHVEFWLFFPEEWSLGVRKLAYSETY